MMKVQNCLHIIARASIASYLEFEQGQRLDNVNWQLWYLQNLMTDTDNAKSKRILKKLSQCIGNKLDTEKGLHVVPVTLDPNTESFSLQECQGAMPKLPAPQ